MKRNEERDARFVLAVVVLWGSALLLSLACGVHIPRPAWPTHEDGTAYARCSTTAGTPAGVPQVSCDCATDDSLGYGYIIVECEDVPPPPPPPPPTPSPTPEATPPPTPTPTPEPTPEPTPTPTPEPPSDSHFEDYHTICKWDCDEVREPLNREEPYGFGAALEEANAWVIVNSPDLVQSNQTIAEGGDHRQEIEYAQRVAERIRTHHALGAKARPVGASTPEEADSLSYEEVAVYSDSCTISDAQGHPTSIGACRAHFDLCIASGAPAGRCFVGPQIRIFVLLGTRSASDSPPPAQTCTVPGIVENGSLKQFSSVQAACTELLALLDWQGRFGGNSTRPVQVGDEIWHLDQGSGGGWLDPRCNRWTDRPPHGRPIGGPERAGIRCTP